MITFFCTRCGVQLQLDGDPNGQLVRCARCTATVRSPEPTTYVPVAQVALDDEPAIDTLGRTLHQLGHAVRAITLPAVDTIETIAERLTRVEPAPPEDSTALTDCPHCGSAIASFVGRCPFCRHPLRGS